MTTSSEALQATAVLSLILWVKVVASNLGLGGTKSAAGDRAPEDSYQASAAEVSEATAAAYDRAQRAVNNDLENIPYVMVLAWASVFCIRLGLLVDEDKRSALSTTHIVLYTVFVVMRILHSIAYNLALSIPRSIAWLVGLLCSIGIAINCIIAAFEIRDF